MRKLLGKLVLSCAVFAAMFVGTRQAKADLINGSFENPINVYGVNDTANQNFVDYYAPGDQAQYDYNSYPGALLTGWTVVSGSVDIVNQSDNPWGWNAFEGNQSLDLNGWDGGTISQSFGTTVGASYILSFAYSNNPWNGGTDYASVTVGNASLQLVHSGATLAAMGWQTVFLGFTASSTTTTLTFASENGGTGGIALDAISIPGAVGIAAFAVPEPSSIALLGLGGFGLAIGAYRRQRNVAA